MYIAVNSITDLKTPQACHGKNLARFARECFANHQPLTVDFEGIKTFTNSFLQELLVPLLAEYGAEFLNKKLQLINVPSNINEIAKSAFSHLDEYFDRQPMVNGQACDLDIYELNLAWLIKAREVARDNALLAELMMGIAGEELRSALSQLSIDDIQSIAQSGWLCFSPRFTAPFIQSMNARPHDVVNVLLGLSGSV